MAEQELDKYALLDADQAFLESQMEGDSKAQSVRAAITAYLDSVADPRGLDLGKL